MIQRTCLLIELSDDEIRNLQRGNSFKIEVTKSNYSQGTNSKYLSTEYVCQLLNISRVTLYKYIKSDKIKASKIGRKYVFTQEDIDLFVSSKSLKAND